MEYHVVAVWLVIKHNAENPYISCRASGIYIMGKETPCILPRSAHQLWEGLIEPLYTL